MFNLSKTCPKTYVHFDLLFVHQIKWRKPPKVAAVSRDLLSHLHKHNTEVYRSYLLIILVQNNKQKHTHKNTNYMHICIHIPHQPWLTKPPGQACASTLNNPHVTYKHTCIIHTHTQKKIVVWWWQSFAVISYFFLSQIRFNYIPQSK